jgi:hypothetical protein
MYNHNFVGCACAPPHSPTKVNHQKYTHKVLSGHYPGDNKIARSIKEEKV